jgi:hypothetical protein
MSPARTDLSGWWVDDYDGGRITRLRYRITVGDQTFDVEGHRFSHQGLALFPGLGSDK